MRRWLAENRFLAIGVGIMAGSTLLLAVAFGALWVWCAVGGSATRPPAPLQLLLFVAVRLFLAGNAAGLIFAIMGLIQRSAVRRGKVTDSPAC